jgi:hypothetical protein
MMTELEAFVLSIDSAIRNGAGAEQGLHTIVTRMAVDIRERNSIEHLRAATVDPDFRVDDDNLEHLERHIRHALEDFEQMVSRIKDNSWRIDDVEELMLSISHHLRHAAFRSGVEKKRAKERKRA